jgi:hypothetical protein
MVVADLLSQFPAQWDYRLAPNEEKDQFHAVLGELLAEELVVGLEGTHAIDELLSAARAQICKTWLPDARLKLEKMIRADQFVSDHPEADVQRELDLATTAVGKAEKKLLEAQAAYDQAAAAQIRAEATRKSLADAQAVLGTGDLILTTAFAALKSHTQTRTHEH